MTNRNIAFEAWRFIFILFMVLHHLDAFNGIDIPLFSENIKKFCVEGFSGVNFFFMLSGLGCVIGYKSRLENQEISVKSFLYKRWLKIYPTYILFLITAVLLYNHGQITDFKKFTLHLLMLQSLPLTENTAFGFNGVAWCISSLMFFYLFFAATYKITLKECLAYIAVLFVLIFTNIIYHNSNGNVMTSLFYTSPVFRLLDFLSGMALGLYFINHKPVRSSMLQAISVIVYIMFLCVGAYGNIPWIYKWGLYYLFPSALLIYSFYGKITLSEKLFNHKFWLPLSSASVVIYLSHQEILNFIKMYMPSGLSKYFYEHFIPWSVICCLLIIVSISVAINSIYAKPIYRKGNILNEKV